MNNRLIIILGIFILSQCAKQTAPTGGPKDETPPKLVETTPPTKTTNFKDTEIQLTFDEFVQLNNPKEQVIITPSIGKKFEVIAKKNKVILKLNSSLKDSTTYTINFRESIQDITEKNPINVKFAFSTGPYMDSLSISGTVKEILTDNFAQTYTVGLAQASDTFNILKHPGTWITLTDKNGKFQIENLKAGRYILYAFDDKNKNLIVDSKSENFGFKSEPIDLTASIKSITLLTQRLNTTKLRLVSAKPIFAYYAIRTSKSVIDYKLTSTDQTSKLSPKLEPDLATIKVYNTIPNQDSLQVRFEATDSVDNKIDTLIYVKFNKQETTQEKLTSKIEIAKFVESNSMFSGIVTFSKPITEFKTDSIYIQIDSATQTYFSPGDFTWNTEHTKLSINKKLNLPKANPESNDATSGKSKKRNSEIHFAKGSFISVEHDTLSKISYVLTDVNVADHATISISTKSKENLIVQLIDTSFKLVEQTTKAGLYKFENIPPSTYMLRIIVDLNKNGKWDPGNYLTNQQPEPIFFYTNPKGGREFILKANWYVGDLLISY